MLHAPLTLTTDKLDISLLLKSSPSPTPTSASQAAGAAAGPHRDSLTRSSSVPLPPAHALPGASSQRTSVSSNVSTATSNAPSTAATQSSFTGQQQQQQHHHQQQLTSTQHRSILPPITGSGAPLPPPQPPLTSPRNLQHHVPSPHQQPLLPNPHHVPAKRPPPNLQHPAASPAKRQSKWTPEEDAIVIELRGAGMKWEDISERLPGRSSISCRLHYQNYLERRSEWDEERKNRLARLYERLKPDMWAPLAAELSIPWRAAEAMHWQLGEVDMARRAGVAPFTLAPSSSAPTMPPAHLQSAGPLHSAPPSLSYMSGAAGPPGPLGPGANFGSYRTSVDMGIDSRDPRHKRAGSASGLPITLGGVSGPPMGPAVLPSLAELERGLTASDGGGGGGRCFEPRR